MSAPITEERPLFKDHLDERLVRQTAVAIHRTYAQFDHNGFCQTVMATLLQLELKARSALIAQTLKSYLPPDYPIALDILLRATLGNELSDVDGEFSFSFDLMPIAQFIELYGLNHFEESMNAMYEITKRYTAEFTIRPFLIQYPQETLAVLTEWVTDENAHVRRLVSEGSRPRLPWGLQLKQFVQDPTPMLPLLATLRNDPSLYVRRSVANHLNDISKDHPQLVVQTLEKWNEDGTKEVAWITGHALRSLVKSADTGALALLGYLPADTVTVERFTITPATIMLGETLTFELTLLAEKTQNLMVDYVIHFVKANGKTSEKVFKWRKTKIKAGDPLHLSKNHAIKPITTRKYYAGVHLVEVQLNGRRLAQASFTLGVHD